MRLSDVASGVAVIVLGALIAARAMTFPPTPGQPVGPSLFPTVVGLTLVGLGLTLVLTGSRTRAPLVTFDAWVRKPRMVLHFALVIATLLFYAATVNSLGFLPTSFLVLAGLFLAFGVTPKWIVPAAAIAVFAIHYGFYTLLRVPLPWGVLEGIAW